MERMSARVLLTGGGGFIGSWIVKNMLRRGAAVGTIDMDVRLKCRTVSCADELADQ